MEYRRHTPAVDLAPFVEHYWSVTSVSPVTAVRSVLVPSGRATMQFCLAEPGRRFAPGRPGQPNADVYLPNGTEPLLLEQRGRSHYVGIQFTPWGARALFPLTGAAPMLVAAITDTLPDKNALASTPASELDRWLLSSSPRAIQPEALLASATAMIDRDPTRVVVGDLPAKLGVSASTLYRAFRDRIGLTPKQYVSVMRFRAFTDGLVREGDSQPNALLAGLTGYFDQSHASRDFTRFTGMTATAFREAYDGIARLMAEP